MMLTILLPSLLAFAASLAVSAMIATWLRYAGAWDAVDAEMRSSNPAPLRHVTVRVMNEARGLSPVPVPVVRAGPPVDRARNGRRTAA